MEEPLIPLDAVTDPQNGPANRWLYKPSTVAFKNVGSSNWADTMSLVNIQKNVCAEINRKLFNDPTIYQTATGTVSSWTGLFTGLDLSSDPATDPSGTAPGRVEQCLEMTDGVYVYYRVVHEL